MMLNQNNTTDERSALSLQELNMRIRKAVGEAFPETYWVRAEMSDVRANASSGHCYLEFVEKSAATGQLVAKARASIWAKTFRMLKPYFEMETGRAFASGLKVLVKVSVEFHELYGFSLTVLDIDPAYTLGDMVQRRMEIVRQLQQEGVFSLNKELSFPALPQRIAVITSPTAAGYEDFLNQLLHNKSGYAFYPKLFPALMQGERTEESVIAALDRVYQHKDKFDVVVIIRGGGATSELSSFDTYLLAASCAQFPLPLVSGIGHERDDTIVDLVSHTRMKTPTAVAEFLIARVAEVADEVDALQQCVCSKTTELLATQKNYLQLVVNRLPDMVTNRIERNRSSMSTLQLSLTNSITTCLAESTRFLQFTEQFIKMASPAYILQRGYSLTLKDGQIVKRAASLCPGDTFTTRFSDGEVTSTVNETLPPHV